MKSGCSISSSERVGVVHIVGIGGIGMSGIAELLRHYGYKVQGSDLHPSYVTNRLEEMGIKVFIGHHSDNVLNASIIVRSTAVLDNNIEIIKANELKLPVIARSEMLAELMRFKHAIAVSGTHGKTTTTSLIGTILTHAKMQPTVINGGIINQLGSNVQLGTGDLMVVEADESDGTFIKIPSYIAVVTNIDPEHMDYYGDFANVKKAYLQFISTTPFYGFSALCFDHPELRELAVQALDHKIFSYAIDHDADLRASNLCHSISGSTFDIILSEQLARYSGINTTKIEGFFVPLHGRHNVLNALAAILVTIGVGAHIQFIKVALSQFSGVRRRFTKTGEVNDILIIDDYAHHPVEIHETLTTAAKVAKMRGGKVIALIQPHRYSRVSSMMDEFACAMAAANVLLISDIYAAGEEHIDGICSTALIDKVLKCTGQSAIYISQESEIAPLIKKIAKPNDLVIMMGAGDVTKWSYALPAQLRALLETGV